ncbi:MAG: hypothetical protein ACTSSE_05535 [Candidatus Thorarchaeota archaeon]
MRMRALNAKYPSTILILLMFITTMSFVPPVYLNANRGSDSSDGPLTSSPDNSQDDIKPIEDQYTKINDRFISESDTIHNGVLNPVVVEQSGYAASENLSARTDTYENLAYDLPLDSAHNWVADEAEVAVWNLEKLYAVNGSYSDGYPGINVNPNGTVDYYPLGWAANSTDTDTYTDDLQLAAYDTTGRRYVSVESQGGKVGQDRYGHIAGTRIVWSQIVQNTPYTEDFEFSFDYFYLRGPIDGPTGNDPVTGNCSLALFIDGVVVWNMSLLLLSQRSVWYSLANNPITISGVPSSFTLELGLVIDESLVLNYKTADYDGDPSHLPDGVGNAAYITVYMDDISFIKATPPTPQEVKLEFTKGETNASLSGSSGLYYASVVNTSYWTTEPVSVALTSNTSISFDYKTRLLSHRFTDSNWETNIASTGVSYSIEYGNSTELTMYSYVGYLGDYEDPQMEIVFPDDWENVTVSDPFLTVQTGECTISGGHLTVPSSIIEYLGWWEVRFESPNYAKSIDIQKYDSSVPEWNDDTIYRIGNTTRTQVAIGTTTDTPTVVDNVNVTWSLPDGGEWTSESLSGGVAGQVTGSSHVLTPGSSPVGGWCIEISWTNGTEVAFDIATFEVHHSANLVGDPEVIETDAGLVVTGIVRYTDGDTGAYIMDSLATVSANWSLSTVYFDANSVKNWWEVSLDTADIGAGNFIVQVDATRPYYDAASCDIQIVSTNVTRLNSPNAPWTSAQWGSEVSLTFNFEVYDSGTDTWGPVVNSSDVSVDLNWTAGYWTVIEDVTPGIYLIDIDTSALPSGTYLLDTTFEKPDHESKQLFLTMIVSPIASSLVVLGDTSARVNISDDYPLKLRFADQTEVPIASASVVVDSISPVVGLSHTIVDEVSGEPGNYSLTLTPTAAGVYTVRFVATEANSEPGSTVFVLVVNDVETSLVVPGGNSFEIGLTDLFNTTFTYETLDYTGIESASISILYSGTPGGISWDLVEKGLGEYSVEFSASLSGTYVVTIAAFKQYYQSASDSFFLVVRDISTNFTILNGTAGIVSYGKDYNLFLSYTNGSAFGLEGADISIESVVPETGLSWGSVIPDEPGIYSILLTPEYSNTFTILLRASLLNHQVQFARFTITATAIASSLTVLNTSTTIAFDQDLTVYIQYQDEDLFGLENATIFIQNPPSEVGFTPFEELGGGLYRVTLTPLEIGTFDLVFRAELTGYQSDSAGFVLGASRIQTELQFAGGLSSDSISYLQTSELVIIYERTDFNLEIEGAEISIQMSRPTGLNWSYYEESGAYYIQLEPSNVGRWILTISASKIGYSVGSAQFILDVRPVQFTVQLLTLPTAVEGVDFSIEIALTLEGTATPVSEALAEFRMTAAGNPVGTYEAMEETEIPGVYRATFTFPLYQSASEYELEIRISKDYYEQTGGTFTSLFSKSEDLVLRMVPVATGSGLFIVVLIGSVIGLRMMNTRKRRKNLEALQVKARFDDVSNILGIITLHKKTGLPVYSKMIKGGFEEAMISAFITAITHFRSEFEMDEKHWDFNVIPISDIISAVPTRSLIVAFITVRPPSKYQASAMEEFGRATGALYDELLADSKVGLVDPSQTEIFDTLFYDLLDGILIENFRTIKDADFPKSMQCLVTAAQQLENGEGFKLEDLAKGMATCGIEETHAYKIVMDAIDDNLIEVADDEDEDNDEDIIPPPPAESTVREFDEESEIVPSPPPETDLPELDEDDEFTA